MSPGLPAPTLSSMWQAFALGLFSLCLAATKPAVAPEVTATIVGTVVDPTRAVIAGAAIVASGLKGVPMLARVSEANQRCEILRSKAGISRAR
jgi:hypothetical protein